MSLAEKFYIQNAFSSQYGTQNFNQKAPFELPSFIANSSNNFLKKSMSSIFYDKVNFNFFLLKCFEKEKSVHIVKVRSSR